jgi:flagellar motor switch protein FliM
MAGDDAAVYADGVPVHRARAGRSGTHRAIQILGPHSGEETR